MRHIFVVGEKEKTRNRSRLLMDKQSDRES
jgi:hypothetical protein